MSVIAIETTETLITARANDALLLKMRSAATRRAFQLKLSDELRFLREADVIICSANGLLGPHLDVSRSCMP